MNNKRRRELKEEFWASQEASIEAYGDSIDRLLDLLTDEQLEAFVVEDSGENN